MELHPSFQFQNCQIATVNFENGQVKHNVKFIETHIFKNLFADIFQNFIRNTNKMKAMMKSEPVI